MIKVIIDSGGDQSQWLEDHYDVGFLPLGIILNNESYLDKQEITKEELHQAMKDGVMPSTSQPSPGQIREVLEKYHKRNEKVIFISIWQKLSGTFQLIKNTIENFKEEYPDFEAEVIDCNSASVASNLLAIQAVEMVKSGYNFTQIVEQTRDNAENISIYLAADDLKWLVKGGRLSKTAGFIGSALNVKPIITVNDEELYSQEVVRGKKRVYKKIIGKIKNDTAEFPNQLYLISHVNQEENAMEVKELLKKQIPEAEAIIFEFSAVLAVHIGLGGISIAGFKKQPETYILPTELI